MRNWIALAGHSVFTLGLAWLMFNPHAECVQENLADIKLQKGAQKLTWNAFSLLNDQNWKVFRAELEKLKEGQKAQIAEKEQKQYNPGLTVKRLSRAVCTPPRDPYHLVWSSCGNEELGNGYDVTYEIGVTDPKFPALPYTYRTTAHYADPSAGKPTAVCKGHKHQEEVPVDNDCSCAGIYCETFNVSAASEGLLTSDGTSAEPIAVSYDGSAYTDLIDAGGPQREPCRTSYWMSTHALSHTPTPEADYWNACNVPETGRHYEAHFGCETEKKWKGREAKEYFRSHLQSERYSWSTLADGTVACKDNWYYLICEQGTCEKIHGEHFGSHLHEFKYPGKAQP